MITSSGAKIEVKVERGYEVATETVDLDGHKFQHERGRSICENHYWITVPGKLPRTEVILCNKEGNKNIGRVSAGCEYSWYFYANSTRIFIRPEDQADVMKMIDEACEEASTDQDWIEYQKRVEESERRMRERDEKEEKFRSWMDKFSD